MKTTRRARPGDGGRAGERTLATVLPKGNSDMLTRHDLADLSRVHETDLVLSVYIARDGSDPGNRAGWRLRLDAALGAIRAGLEREAPGDLESFEQASKLVMSGLDAFGRVLPHDGWAAFATANELFHAEVLPFAPTELARWRQGIYVAPYVRTFKSDRPMVLALMDRWRARLFQYQDGHLTLESEVGTDRPSVDASDVAAPSRVSPRSGTRGMTRTDYAERMIDEESRRQRKHAVEAILAMAGDAGGVALGGMPKTLSAVRKDLEEKLAGRIVELSDVSFESTDSEITTSAATAASDLTRSRQSRLLEACKESPERGSTGWNRTYRALAAGAVDTLLVSRNLIESSPEDAERLVRLALAQGAAVEELGDELGARLWAEAEGVAARLRFRVAVA
jgi:hypothetical protein